MKPYKSINKIRVLIVDDCPVARDALVSILRSSPDIEVVDEAGNGPEGIEKAQQLQPTVILMDAQMPEMDGAEATRHIKERVPGTKVLFLSVYSWTVEGAIDAGADACLMKDCSRFELLKAVRKLAATWGRSMKIKDSRITGLKTPEDSNRKNAPDQAKPRRREVSL